MRVALRYVVMVFSASLWGCPAEVETPIAVPEVEQTASPEAEKMFHEAVGAFEAERDGEAEEKFSEFLRMFPTDPLRGQVLVYRGRIAMRAGEFTSARKILHQVTDAGEGAPSYDFASMYLGICEYELRNYAAAIEILSPYAGRFANPEENRNVLRTLVKSAAAQDDWKQQFRWIEQLLRTNPPPEERAEMLLAVANRVAREEEKQLAAAASQLSEKADVWTQVTAQIARIQFENGQYDRATDTIEEIRESGGENAAAVADLIALIEKRNSVDIRTIGCMLPLSGKMRLVGQDTLKGVMFAAGRNRFGRENSPLSVVMRDTAASGKSPEEMVEELVLKERVAAIVGPMDAKWARRAAQKAQRMGVPMILLSADDTATDLGNYVFRKFASHRAELDALTRYAESVVSSDIQYGVLYPQNSYGTLMLKMLQSKQREQGIEVAAVGFAPDLTDFGSVAAELADKSFNALLLPMTSEQLALAAPALAASGLWPSLPQTSESAREALYLVPSVGFSPSVVTRAGRYLQGAVFVGDFKTDRTAAVVSFSRGFENEYKVSPSTFAAYGYDVTLLISNAIRAGVESRRDLRTWLDEVVASEGLVFPFDGFDAQGESTALPSVLTLEGKELVAR